MARSSKSPAPRSSRSAKPVASPSPSPSARHADTFAVVALVLLVWGLDLQSFLTPVSTTAKIGPIAAQFPDAGYPLTIFAFMCSVVDKLASEHAARGLHALHSFVLCMTAAFGGGILIPLLTCNTQVYLREEAFLWFLLAAWFLTHRTGGAWTAVYRSQAVKLLGDILFQVMRMHMITNFCKMGNEAWAHGGGTFEEPKSHFDAWFGNPAVRLAGPIIMGALGGSAAAFLLGGPSLAPISGESGVSPLVAQAAAAAAMYWIPANALALRLPLPFGFHNKLVLPAAAQLEAGVAQAVAAAFLVCVCVFNGGSVDLRTLPANFAAKLKQD